MAKNLEHTNKFQVKIRGHEPLCSVLALMDLGVSGTTVEEDCSKSRLSQGEHSKTMEFHSESKWLEGVSG